MMKEKTKLYFALCGFAILAFVLNLVLFNLLFDGLTARNSMLNIISLIGMLLLLAADGWFCAVFLQRKVREILQDEPDKNEKVGEVELEEPKEPNKD